MLQSSALLALIAANPEVQAAYDASDDAQVASLLNAQTSVRQVPADVSVPIIFGLLSEPSLARLNEHNESAAIRDDLVKGTAEGRLAIAHWATLLAARPSGDDTTTGTITRAEMNDVIQHVLVDTQDVPASLAEIAFAPGLTVSAGQVSLARTPPATLASLTVHVTSPLVKGATAQATVTGLGSNGQPFAVDPAAVTWKGEFIEITAVFHDGSVHARAVGSSAVIASVGDIIGQAVVTVTAD